MRLASILSSLILVAMTVNAQSELNTLGVKMSAGEDALHAPLKLTNLAGLANQTKVRDLRSYEKAGPFNIALNLDAQSRMKLEAEVREFVWKHWRERRLGYVTFTKFSKEGEPSTSHLFVEPDEEGVWRLAIKIDRLTVERRGSKGWHGSSNEYIAYALERIEVPTGGLDEAILIPEADLKKPDLYRLVLKNKEGKVLSRL